MNKTKDKLTNAVFQDDIPNGASLNEDSIKVYYLEVDINGKQLVVQKFLKKNMNLLHPLIN